MTQTVTILGCGSSGGVPRVGSGWGACDPHNPKNRRRRCSILVQKTGDDGTTSVLVTRRPICASNSSMLASSGWTPCSSHTLTPIMCTGSMTSGLS